MIWYIIIIDEDKDDDDAFIFTLKNPYKLKPIRFFKRKGVEYSIECNPNKGPTFCDGKKKVLIFA